MGTKYHSQKTIVDGIIFQSKKEGRRYFELRLMEKAGKIADLQRQVKYVLIPAQYEGTGEYYKKGIHKGEEKKRLVEHEISYVADFVYEQDGETIVEDTKGYRTDIYIAKRKMMLYFHGIKIKEI